MRRDQKFRDQPSLFGDPIADANGSSNGPCQSPAADARAVASNLARASHPATSKLAADTLISAGKFATDEAAAMELVEAYPGRTGYELDKIDGTNDRRISKRLGGLANKGLLRRGKRRLCGAKGSQCVTWYVVENNDGE
ncbi:hypothetical protein [Planctomycetes bacterium TBK1r]|uniref:Uncharacterized protein n=1 Tax=Stieleria magnilauensis TaxID=2527963 RepID=A0ABX5XSI2_9BACT|nr:hypothetical protein TBK1r_39100 [Planctomycetes bacterium TBK1r]